jgi:hypothetical protein
MAKNPHFLLATRNSMLDLITTALSASGALRMYAGVQPTDASSATTAANVIVASLVLAATAFVPASNGVMTANTITSDSSAVGGSANWMSLVKSTGLRVADGSIGTTTNEYDLVMNSQAVATGATVACSTFTITIAA